MISDLPCFFKVLKDRQCYRYFSTRSHLNLMIMMSIFYISECAHITDNHLIRQAVSLLVDVHVIGK